MGGLSLADALALCELLAATDPKRYERAALRWLQRFIDERLPPLAEVGVAASALTELRHGRRAVGVDGLKRVSGCSSTTASARDRYKASSTDTSTTSDGGWSSSSLGGKVRELPIPDKDSGSTSNA
jgi:hypothetical protein